MPLSFQRCFSPRPLLAFHSSTTVCIWTLKYQSMLESTLLCSENSVAPCDPSLVIYVVSSVLWPSHRPSLGNCFFPSSNHIVTQEALSSMTLPHSDHKAR